MHAKTATRPKAAAPQSGLAEVGQVRDAMAGLLLEAARFLAPDRVEALARGWLARAEPS